MIWERRNSGPKSALNQHFRPISADFSSSFFLCNRKPTPSSSNSTVSTTGRPRRLPLHRHQHHWECSPSSSTSFLPPGLHRLRRCACTISLHFTVQVKYNSLEQWNANSLFASHIIHVNSEMLSLFTSNIFHCSHEACWVQPSHVGPAGSSPKKI